MNTICKFADIDIYLLYFINIDTILAITEISKDQYILMNNLDFIKQLRTIIREYEFGGIIENAAERNYITLIKWISESSHRLSENKFKYGTYTITQAAMNGHIDVLNWFANSEYKFKYSNSTIDYAAENGARRRLRFHRDLIRRRRENA